MPIKYFCTTVNFFQGNPIKHKASGFTLIEVLIATLVLALGLLGLAGLQASSLRNNLSAYHRSQATQLAYDLADRMRVSVVEAKKFTTSTYITVAPGDAAAQAGCTAVAGACSSAQLAQNDLFEWNNNVTNFLTNGQGTIAVVGTIFTITINWDDNRDGNIDGNDPNFQMSFQL